MSLATSISPWLLQAAIPRDTIVTMPVRGWMDYTNGTLQLIVLVLAVVVLAAMAYMLITLKKGLDSLKTTVEKLSEDSRPILKQASLVATDAREVVAMLRTDVERVTHAAGALSEQLLDVAASTEQRMDDINAVIDVVQEELEETALSATAALRGARLGGKALASGLGTALVGALKNKTRDVSAAVRNKSHSRGRDDDREIRLDRKRKRELAREREREREADRPRRTRDSERRYRENG